MSKRPCVIEEGFKKGGWTAEEDRKLISYIHVNDEGGWPDIPHKAGLQRSGKSCRLRWTNNLKPDIKGGEFSYEEEQIISILHASHGNDKPFAKKNGERDKKLLEHTSQATPGIDPVTHKPLAFSNPSLAEPRKFDSQEESNPDELSHSGLASPRSLSISSSSSNTIPERSNVEKPIQCGFLICKKRLERSSSTSRLLNKVASRPSSIGKIFSTSLEGTSRPPTSSSCLPHSLSQHMIDNKEDLGTSIPQFNFSQFLEKFINDEAENIGGYNQDLIMPDVPSTLVDEDNMIEDIADWSSYLVDHADFIYETEQDSDDKNIV